MITVDDINVKNLETFISVLKTIPDTDINMFSAEEPTCGTPGCHAGLVSIAAKQIPELNRIYTTIQYGECGYTVRFIQCILYLINGFKRGFKNTSFVGNYNYRIWGETLIRYLVNGSEDIDRDFEDEFDSFLIENPEWWGNEHGTRMFSSEMAFGVIVKTFPHSVITNHWEGVLERTKEMQGSNKQ